MISLGSEIKAWAVSVEGYGTLIETDKGTVQDMVAHYENRGRKVTVSLLLPAAEQAKPKLLQWHEVKLPGDYWAFPVRLEPVDCDAHDGSMLLSILEFGGELFVGDEQFKEPLSAEFGHYQFMPYTRPTRDSVEFQPEDLTPPNPYVEA